jgi:membrane protease YdiL (CAAX protease family)
MPDDQPLADDFADRPVPVHSAGGEDLPAGGVEPAFPLVPPPGPTEPSLPAALPAPGPPHPGFGFAILWCLAFLSVQIAAVIGIAFVSIIIQVVRSRDPNAFLNALKGAGDGEITPELSAVLAPAMLGTQVAGILFAWLIVRLFLGKEWPRLVALRRPSLSHLVLTILALPGMLLLPGVLYQLAQEVLPKVQGQEETLKAAGQWPLWLGVAAIGLGPGICEELWCRGFLGRGLVGRHGLLGGVLLTSLLFGLLHMSPAYAVPTAFMGLILHFIYLTSRSLWLPMLLHALNNTVAAVAAHYPELDPDAPDHPLPVPLLVAATVLLAVVCWACYRSRVRLVDRGEPGRQAWRPAFPGVEFPPPASDTFVFRPWLGWPASALVAAAGALLVGAVLLS